MGMAERIDLTTKGARAARIVVVADTHSTPNPALTERLNDLCPTAILHAGDIGDLAVLDALARHAPVYAVRGNIDGHAAEIPDERVIDVDTDGGSLRLLLLHIAVTGPRLRVDVARRAQAVGAALVVCGHSHVPFIGVHGGCTVFNPGSAGPRRFALPIVFGTIELDEGRVRLRHLCCETGAPWWPPGGR